MPKKIYNLKHGDFEADVNNILRKVSGNLMVSRDYILNENSDLGRLGRSILWDALNSENDFDYPFYVIAEMFGRDQRTVSISVREYRLKRETYTSLSDCVSLLDDNVSCILELGLDRVSSKLNFSEMLDDCVSRIEIQKRRLEKMRKHINSVHTKHSSSLKHLL